MARKKVCQRPECSNTSAVEVQYILGLGAEYRFAPGTFCKAPAGTWETGVLCEGHAAEAISGDDPPWTHTYFNKPPQVRIVDETPRFSESWGLA